MARRNDGAGVVPECKVARVAQAGLRGGDCREAGGSCRVLWAAQTRDGWDAAEGLICIRRAGGADPGGSDEAPVEAREARALGRADWRRRFWTRLTDRRHRARRDGVVGASLEGGLASASREEALQRERVMAAIIVTEMTT